MNKQRIEIIIAVVGGIIFLVLLLHNVVKIFSSRPSGPEAVSPATTATINAAKLESIFAPKKAEAQKRREAKDLSWGRDPFVLGGGTAEVADTIASLKLMGITAPGNKRAIAIINNELVYEGTRVGKFTVVKILQKKVVVTDGKENFELLLE